MHKTDFWTDAFTDDYKTPFTSDGGCAASAVKIVKQEERWYGVMFWSMIADNKIIDSFKVDDGLKMNI